MFQERLSRYLLRRDKREEESIQKFCKFHHGPCHEYRQQIEICVETRSLDSAWKQAICAAEALSLYSGTTDQSSTQRMRLTMGNGHGISRYLDELHRSEEDKKQDAVDNASDAFHQLNATKPKSDAKRDARAKWWRESIARSLGNADDALLFHPAIWKAVETIEQATKDGEKVLVFGKFTRPMRALVSLLNAKAMLSAIQEGAPWPSAGIRGEQNGCLDDSDWPAVRAVKKQLGCQLSLDEIATRLKEAYKADERNLRSFRESLVKNIKKGMNELRYLGKPHLAVFAAFQADIDDQPNKLPLVSRAISELIGNVTEEEDTSAVDCADAFFKMVEAMSDQDSFDVSDDESFDDEAATAKWQSIERRLSEEMSRTRGSFARLMFGETSTESRRMIQAGFNRATSNPRVLVAQSLVGREGLNLHHACRIVVLLHPEWNPGVVEQQIGRVDRVGSHWSQLLDQATASGPPALPLKRIEVRPIIFRGTYDEWNWQVLQTRWDNLRSQLHGVVIPASSVVTDAETKALVEKIQRMAPCFSPNRGDE